MSEHSLALIATALFGIGILGTIAGAVLHLPHWLEKMFEAEWLFAILGLAFGAILLVSSAPIRLPWSEIVVVTLVTTFGSIGSYWLITTGWMKKLNDLIPVPILVFMTIGMVPVIGSVVGEPAAGIVVAALLFGVFHSLSDGKKYNLISAVFAVIAIGGVLSNFAAPPVAIAAHRWHLSNTQLQEMFLVPMAIAMLLQGLYAVWITKEVHQKSASEDMPSLSFADFWPIGPKTGMFLIGVVMLANYASPVIGSFAFTGEHWQVYVKTGIFTNISDNGGLAEAAVTYLPHPTPSEIYWVLAATLAWAVSTLIANAPNVVVAMLLAKAFGGRVNFVKQMLGSGVALSINVIVFLIYGAIYYGLFGT